MTLPPLNATVSAGAMPPLRAASLVRVFASVAAPIPTSPAVAEHNAPTTKLAAICGPSCHATSAATITTKTARILYSRNRKAIAPTRMSPATCCISELPGECRPRDANVSSAAASPTAPSVSENAR